MNATQAIAGVIVGAAIAVGVLFAYQLGVRHGRQQAATDPPLALRAMNVDLVEARMGSNEAAAIGALRTLCTAQALFREGDKDRDNRLNFAPSLAAIQQTNLIDGVLGSGLKQGYLFRIIRADDSTFSVYAVPQVPGKMGERGFFVDETGVIRFSTVGVPDATSPAIGG